MYSYLSVFKCVFIIIYFPSCEAIPIQPVPGSHAIESTRYDGSLSPTLINIAYGGKSRKPATYGNNPPSHGLHKPTTNDYGYEDYGTVTGITDGVPNYSDYGSYMTGSNYDYISPNVMIYDYSTDPQYSDYSNLGSSPGLLSIPQGYNNYNIHPQNGDRHGTTSDYGTVPKYNNNGHQNRLSYVLGLQKETHPTNEGPHGDNSEIILYEVLNPSNQGYLGQTSQTGYGSQQSRYPVYSQSPKTKTKSSFTAIRPQGLSNKGHSFPTNPDYYFPRRVYNIKRSSTKHKPGTKVTSQSKGVKHVTYNIPPIIINDFSEIQNQGVKNVYIPHPSGKGYHKINPPSKPHFPAHSTGERYPTKDSKPDDVTGHSNGYLKKDEDAHADVHDYENHNDADYGHGGTNGDEFKKVTRNKNARIKSSYGSPDYAFQPTDYKNAQPEHGSGHRPHGDDVEHGVGYEVGAHGHGPHGDDGEHGVHDYENGENLDGYGAEYHGDVAETVSNYDYQQGNNGYNQGASAGKNQLLVPAVILLPKGKGGKIHVKGAVSQYNFPSYQ